MRQATPQSISGLTLDDIKSYYAKVFRPDMTTVAMIGDVTPDETKAVFEKWFGSWKAVGPKPAVTLPAVPANAPSAVNVSDPTAVQDSVELAQQIDVNRFHPDYYALQLGDHVLGGGFMRHASTAIFVRRQGTFTTSITRSTPPRAARHIR